jgi:hypothetical protein
MNRLAKRVLLIGGLSVAAMAAFVVLSSIALTRTLDFDHHCETGFSMFVSCTYERKSTSIGQSVPIFTPPSHSTGALPDGVAQTREFAAGADETWGVVVGRDGVPAPVHLY